jgi:NitT/TauT family transport system substrate-binding protein
MLRVSSLFRSFLLGVIALVLIVACSAQSSKAKPLTVAISPWPGYSGHYIALKKDFFKSAGVTVEEAFFQSASECITALLSGRADVAWVTTGDAVEIINKEPAAKIVYVADYSNGADGILGRDINSPQNLKGKTVAREDLLFEKVLLRAYLEKGGLTEEDIKTKSMTAADAASAFAANKVDAAVTYEPWLTKASKGSEKQIIFTTKDTSLIADVIVTRQQTITNRNAAIKGYIKAIDQGVKSINEGSEDAIAITAEKLGIKPEEAKTQLSGVKVLDLETNKSVVFNDSHPQNAFKNFELTAKAAYDFKILPKPMDVRSMYDDSIVKSL